MPAIRDFVTNYTPAATGTTLVLDAPVLQENDLLLAIICADTGTATWSSSGWTELVRQTNTCQMTVMYKIAGASEASSYTFTASATESFDGGVISIRDVDTTNPFGSTPTYTISNISTARAQMDTITTTVNNSLIIYAVSNSSQNGSPTMIEGPVNYLYTVQGISESSGVGWGFQAATGTTPAVYTSSPSAAAGKKITIQIAAPSGGATVIPPYNPSDASVYVDPIMGTTAYDGNTAFAATATTYFGTSLGGLTLANGTAAAGADYGINPTHSVGNLTTSAAGNWSGATTVVSAGHTYDITGKNIMVHTGPSTPLQYQRLTAAAAAKGVGFGMATSANNWKIWHVHGASTAFVHGRDVPLVINSSNTTGVIGSAGTFNPASVAIYGYFLASQSTTSLYQFYQLWILDTIVIAGGNSTEPVNVTGIKNVIQGHEHRGAVIQGSGELMLFMPVQVGNGGTNSVYLDINNSAIEFPTQYNADSKLVNYCSADNVAGLKYYAGSSDTIKHRDSIISSGSRYFWGLHASSSTSATYDFSGLTVIGAGTITLANAVTISELNINNYSTIDASSLTLNSSSITNVPSGNDSITVNGTTAFNSCSFNVTGVSSGNRLLSTTTPNKFTSCTFTGSASTGHAIRITTTTGSPFAMVGNTFTSFGADGTNSAAIFNDSGGAITINISGGGNTPTVRNGSGASTTINNNKDITITVKDESGGNVASARVAVYKSSDMTELMNTTTNGSGVATASVNYVSDIPVIIRVRKSSTGASKYIAVETSGTVTTNGLTATVTFIADNIAESTTSGTIAGDFTINTTTKTIRHVVGETPIYTVKELYTWLMDYFDDSGLMDDTVPMTAQTPSEYTLVNGWFIDDTSTQFLKSGAIQSSGWTHPTNTTGIRILTLSTITGVDDTDLGTAVAGVTTGDTGKLIDYNTTMKKLWVRTDAADDDFNNTSETINVNGSGAGSMGGSAAVTGETIYSNVFTLGTLVSGTTLDVYQNDSQITPFWTSGQIDILVKVKEASVEIDSGNLTVLARKYGTLYDHTVIDASTGRNPVPLAAFDDGNNDTSEGGFGGAPYTSMTITFGTVSADVDQAGGNEPYDVSINGGTGTILQIYEYLKYVTRTGSSTTLNGANGEYYQAVGEIRFTYTTGSGTITQGNTITDTTSGATGYITSKIDASNTLVVTRTHGTFTNGDSISSAGATGTINSVPESITQSKQAPFGTFAGGQFFGARGVYIYNVAPADANNYQLIDSTNTSRTPPATISTIITVQDLSTASVIQGANVLVWVTNNANYFYQATVSITGTGTTATVSHTAHGMITGDYVIIEGVTNDDDYNGVFEITKTGDNSYTYTTTETLDSSPATGTIKATFALISGTTNASGQVSDIRSLGSNQPISGWARKSSGSPYYQQGVISGTVDSSSGFSVTIQLARDE